MEKKVNAFVSAMNAETTNSHVEELKAKAEAINKENQKLINNTPTNTIIETVEDVKNGAYGLVKDERGNAIDVGGHHIGKVVRIEGRTCYVCGYSEQEVQEDEDYIRLAILRGDVALPSFPGGCISGRYITRVIMIGGQPVLTVGHTEAEREEDEHQARICYAKLRGGNRITTVNTAEELIDAQLEPTKEFEKNGRKYIYFESQKCARTYSGEKVADISDVPDNLDLDLKIEILKGRIK